MKNILNAFLLLFFVDGLIAVIDELLRHYFAMAHLELLSNALTVVMIVSAFAMYIAIGIDRRILKPLFITLTIFVFFANLLCFPLLMSYQLSEITISLTICQLALSLFAFFYIRYMTGESFFITDALLSKPSFSAANTLVFFSVNVLFVPFAVVLYMASSAFLLIEQSTAGYMKIRQDGIYLKEKIFTKQNNTIRLVGMIHIGQKKYYKELSKTLTDNNAVLLAEGVSDKGGLLKSFPSFGNVASVVGLETQHSMQLQGEIIELADYLDSELVNDETVKIVYADVDSSELSKEAIDFLQDIGEYISSMELSWQGLLSYLQWYAKNITPEQEELVFSEILQKRNEVVVEHIDRALVKFDVLIVPWGAMHMPEIQQSVLDRGFVLEKERLRMAIEYAAILDALKTNISLQTTNDDLGEH